MTDKRNIVIKVKYPVSDKVTENLAPKMITEWNVKRILFAAGALVMILTSLFYVINNDTQKNDLDNAAVIVNAVEKQATPQIYAKQAEIKNLVMARQVVAKTNSSVKLKKKLNKQIKRTAIVTVKDIETKRTNEKKFKERGYLKINH